jgi:aryl-alcohol dehydrogenase-like predicted oxidoreductase
LGTASWALHDRPLEKDAAVRVLSTALENGVTMIDTALAYTTAGEDSYAEHLIGAALRRLDAKGSVLVATKGGHFRRDNGSAAESQPRTT